MDHDAFEHAVTPPGRKLARGVAVAVVMFTVAVLVAHLPGVHVHAGAAAPLEGAWSPRVGVGTVPALALLAWAGTPHPWAVMRRLSWGRLLLAVWALSLAWMVSLALVDGADGIGAVLNHDTEYLATARTVDDTDALLRSFTGRIPLAANNNWPVHVAGHPPGALLFFVGLVRLGLGSGLAAGLVVVTVVATVPVAVAVACRALGQGDRVGSVLPFLVLGPFAVWQAVSADAVFAAAAAWTVAFAALTGAARSRPRRLAWAICAGLGLGGCAMLSYGLPLIAAVVLAALVAAHGWHRDLVALLAVVAVGAAGVVGGFAVVGFSYWEAYPVLRQRYWDGLASARPGWYWLWANLALLAVSAGPVLFGALGASGRRIRDAVVRPQDDPVLTLVTGAVVAVAVADLSLMSKAEVERIWLPFVPWLLLATVLVPVRWRRLALVGQAGLGLLVQTLLVTPW
ncbi:hypothetical protein ABEG17_12915 [Pedococcus sp. KACC 23699]|uniref:Glycosyltransferase RgtA/B/C/D-like domain-containing protein n=1 Tax=Pedococcus sp. KACC 23699 TaxID=3149228 RepID=A0AAU7JRD6_9MICO